ncbi:MAG: zinc ribbon domain-containing protein [Deltaproteobacteria bacterium]|nr:zinc ribbon domain-containing protein [Deltaproteobacteria bacterium]
MPIYEYQCIACGNEFEALVSISGKDKPACPECESTKLKKKMSVTASSKGGCGTCASTSSCSSRGHT